MRAGLPATTTRAGTLLDTTEPVGSFAFGPMSGISIDNSQFLG
jgi:hypothetical protein